MKKFMTCLLTISLYVPVCLGSLVDVPQTADGFLTVGEYASLSVTLVNSEELLVKGGGAYSITTKDQSYLEVQYTSTPLSNSSGIYDIVLGNNSKLLYLGGITQEITVGNNAKAYLKGGRIDGITLYRRPQDSCFVTIYCRSGYQKNTTGISGLWADGTGFDIEFINASAPYPPTSNYINVEVIPEPATLLLLGLGGLLIRRKM